MESIYEVEDELRELITRYAAACEERELDPIEQLTNLAEEELKNN